MKIFVFAAVVVAFIQLVAATVEEGCTFNAQEACDRCDFSRSYVQYVANPCNCNEYFSCEKTRGYITAHRQNCASCLCFSDETWGCTIYNSEAEGCPAEPPITEIVLPEGAYCYRYGNGASGVYLQQYAEASGEDFEVGYNWIVNNYPVTMPCPYGTWFNFTECKCVHCVPNHRCAQTIKNDACFDWDDFNSGNKKVYYDAASSCSVSSPSVDPPHALQLNGQCNVEVPYFQKNEFSQFTLCTTFRATGSGPAGLAFDGGRPSDNDCHPSIFLELNANDNLVGGIYTGDSGSPFTVTGQTIVLGDWYSACLRYDGNTLELLVGARGLVGASSSSSVSASGSTVMNNCNMLIGSTVDQNTGVDNFFHGEISKWCFARTYWDPVSHGMV